MNNDFSLPYENDDKGLSVSDVELGQNFVSKSLIKNPLLIEFINFSHYQNDKKQQAIAHQVKKRLRNLRIYVAILVVLIAVAISFAWYANISNKEAVVAKNDALKSQSSLLLKSVEEENKNHNYGTGILLGLNALPGIHGGDRPWVNDVSTFRKSVLFSHKTIHFDEKLAQQHAMDKKGTKVIQFHYQSNIISIFSIEDKERITKLKLDGRVISANISENGEFVSVLDEQGNLSVFVAKSGKLISKFVNKAIQNEKLTDGDLNLSFSADNTKLMVSYRFTANGGGYSIYRILDGILLNHVNKDKDTVLAWAKWHPNGTNVISLLFKRIATSEAWIELDYLLPEGHITSEKLPGSVEIKNEYQVSPNGEFIAFSNNVWSLNTLKLVTSNKENSPLLFLSDEKLIVKDDNKLKVISTTTGKEVKHWLYGNSNYLFSDAENEQLLGFGIGSGIRVYDDKSDSYPNKQEFFKNISILDVAFNQKQESITILALDGVYSIPLSSQMNTAYILPKSTHGLFYSNATSDIFDEGALLTINKCFVCNNNAQKKYFMWKWHASKMKVETQQLQTTFGYVNKNASVMAVRVGDKNRIDLYNITLTGKIFKNIRTSWHGVQKFLADNIEVKNKLSTIHKNSQRYQFNNDGTLFYVADRKRLNVYDVNNGTNVGHVTPINDGYIEDFSVLNSGEIIIAVSDYKNQKKIMLWSKFKELRLVVSLKQSEIKRKVNHYTTQWGLSTEQTKLIVSLDGYTLDIYSFATGKKIKSTIFNDEISNLSNNSENILISLKSGHIYHWNISQKEDPVRWFYQTNAIANFVTPRSVLLSNRITSGYNVVVPFNKKEELLKLAVKKLPINRKCLSDLERESFGLPSLTYREKVRLTCEN